MKAKSKSNEVNKSDYVKFKVKLVRTKSKLVKY